MRMTGLPKVRGALPYLLYLIPGSLINSRWVMIRDLQIPAFADPEIGFIGKKRGPAAP
jgi:hypothetical protein